MCSDYHPELQVYRSLDHMYCCKIILFVYFWRFWRYLPTAVRMGGILTLIYSRSLPYLYTHHYLTYILITTLLTHRGWWCRALQEIQPRTGVWTAQFCALAPPSVPLGGYGGRGAQTPVSRDNLDPPQMKTHNSHIEMTTQVIWRESFLGSLSHFLILKQMLFHTPSIRHFQEILMMSSHLQGHMI